MTSGGSDLKNQPPAGSFLYGNFRTVPLGAHAFSRQSRSLLAPNPALRGLRRIAFLHESGRHGPDRRDFPMLQINRCQKPATELLGESDARTTP